MPFSAEHALRSRKDFPALQRHRDGLELAFLDGPGGSQVPNAVIEAIADVYATCNVNTHGNFPPSREVDRRMQAAREVVATFLGAAAADCISFGQNMTTLNYCVELCDRPHLNRAMKCSSRSSTTRANRGPWLGLHERGILVQEVRLLSAAYWTTRTWRRKFRPAPSSSRWAPHRTRLGTVNDIALARRLTREVGALLLIDAVHYAPHFPLDVRAMDADFLLCSAYKFYGPHVGVLYSKPGALDRLPTDRLSMQDPAAPYRIETGTLNHAAIDGVRAAIDYLAGWGAGATLRERIVDAMSEHRRL